MKREGGGGRKKLVVIISLGEKKKKRSKKRKKKKKKSRRSRRWTFAIRGIGELRGGNSLKRENKKKGRKNQIPRRRISISENILFERAEGKESMTGNIPILVYSGGKLSSGERGGQAKNSANRASVLLQIHLVGEKV